MFNGTITESLKKHALKEAAKAKANATPKKDPNELQKLNRDLGALVGKFKSLSAGNDNKVMSDYLAAIETTKGDYSRRTPKIREKVSYMESFIQELLMKDSGSDLKYTTLGVFDRVWKMLHSPQFIGSIQKVYMNSKDPKAENSTDTYRIIYACMVFFVEMVTIHLVKFEYQIAGGTNPVNAIEDMMAYHKGFTKSVVYSMISLVTFLEAQKGQLPANISKLIEDDKLVNATSSEVAATVLLTSAAIAVWPFAVAGFGIILSIFLLRSMFYYIGTLKIDIAHLLEYEAELLTNNIRNLQAQLASERDPQKKAKIQAMIDKQIQWANRFDSLSRSILTQESEATYASADELAEEEKYDEGKVSAYDSDVII